ncbi:hypothetical protein ACHAXS_010843 [Conticribra weissflogii]
MGVLDITIRRIAPAAVATGLATWASITTLNDDWDDYFPPSSSSSSSPAKEPEKIVILGSGWAALSALRKCASPGKSIVVVSPRPHFLYTPLLASSSVGTITLRSACEPLRALVERAAERATSATFVRADARDIDTLHKKVLATTDSHRTQLELSYDKLVIAVGAEPNTFHIPGVQDHALFLKEAEDSARLHARLLHNLEKAAALIRHGREKDGDDLRAEIDRLLTVVVCGGGPTGVELAAELADFARNDVARRYGEDIAERIRIVLVEAMPRILAPFDERLANVAKEHLISRGVEVRTGVAVTSVKETIVTFAPSTPRDATPEQTAEALANSFTEETGALVWAAGIGARPLVKKLAKALGQTDLRGLKVDENLRVVGADDVYAVGDAALSGYPPTAQVAAQQGKHVGRAIRDGNDSKFVYHHAGSLCCLGSDNGIAQLRSSSSSYFNVWDFIGAPPVGPNDEHRAVTGTPAFLLWRSLYWTKLLSTSSRLSLGSDWIRAHWSGRDVVEPVLKRNPTVVLQRPPVESFGTELRRNHTIKLVDRPSTLATAAATKNSLNNMRGNDGEEGAIQENRRKRFWFF